MMISECADKIVHKGFEFAALSSGHGQRFGFLQIGKIVDIDDVTRTGAVLGQGVDFLDQHIAQRQA